MTDEDRLLILALQEHEDTLCSCGYPIDHAWDGDSEGEYEVRERKCYACAPAEGHKVEGKKPGRKVTVVRLPPNVNLGATEA